MLILLAPLELPVVDAALFEPDEEPEEPEEPELEPDEEPEEPEELEEPVELDLLVLLALPALEEVVWEATNDLIPLPMVEVV